MRTAIDADRNAQSGYIAEDKQTKPEALTQPIPLRSALKLLTMPRVDLASRSSRVTTSTSPGPSTFRACARAFPPRTGSTDLA